MKKLYNLLFILPLILITSCEEDGNEVVNLKNQDPVVSVTGISPEQGYTGDQFTVNVTDFGGAKDFVKVFIGENQAKIFSCSDKSIVAEVPKDATTGKVKITFFEKEFTTDLMYKVLGKPSIEAMSSTWGFIDDEITFSGIGLGTKAEDIQLFFGKSKTKAKLLFWSDTEFTVKVPKDATSGKITLHISTQKNMNTPSEFEVRTHATLTAIAPAEAYKKSKVTISGTNFGTTTEDVIVLFGDKEGEVVSCTEQAIEVKVPMEATEGAVKVTVETSYEKVEGELDFKITSTPVVASDGVSPLEGYIGSEIAITGTKMPKNTDDMSVKFGTINTVITPASYSVDNDGKGILKVIVPNGLSTGKVKLVFTIAGLEICSKDFTVLPAPTVNAFVSKLVRTECVLTGTGFPTNVNDINVTFGDKPSVHPSTVSTTQMMVQVPNDFVSGKVKVAFKGIPVQLEAGNVQALKVGDVTGAVLKNSIQPFKPTADYTSGSWAVPVDWRFNSNFAGGAILFSSAIPEGLLAMQCGWGQPNKQDAKMYQVITLPEGTYKFTLNVAECGTNKGRFGVIFGVTKGNATLPELTDQLIPKGTWMPSNEANLFVDASNNKSYYRISDNRTAHQKDLLVTLAEEAEVTIGFVTQMNQEGFVKLSSINVTLE